MGADYKYYEIDVADIWQYERSLLLSGKSSVKLANKIIKIIEEVIIKKGKPFLATKDYDSGDNKFQQSFATHYNDFHDSRFNLESRYNLNYFFTNDYCFYYSQKIILNNNNEDFDFLFALKLRQYNSKIFELINFLDFQFGTSFKNDVKDFFKFLKFGILKDQADILEGRVIDAIDNWIDTRNNKIQLSNKSARKMQGEINSLLLKEIQINSSYFQKTDNRIKFNEIFLKLKEGKFISNETAFDNFIAIFNNKEISKNKRIIWVGAIVELQWFVKYLVYNAQKVEDLKNDIWVVTINCFVNSKMEEFTIPQLRDAKGKRLNRKELIEEILSTI